MRVGSIFGTWCEYSHFTQFMGKDIDEDEDDYDKENEESGELWKTMNLWNFFNELTIQAMIQV